MDSPSTKMSTTQTISEIREWLGDRLSTAPAVRDLARKLAVETPICEAVAAILAGETDVQGAIDDLLSRPIRDER